MSSQSQCYGRPYRSRVQQSSRRQAPGSAGCTHCEQLGHGLGRREDGHGLRRMAGVETGPGMVLTAIGGGIAGGIAGYMGADWIADWIYED